MWIVLKLYRSFQCVNCTQTLPEFSVCELYSNFTKVFSVWIVLKLYRSFQCVNCTQTLPEFSVCELYSNFTGVSVYKLYSNFIARILYLLLPGLFSVEIFANSVCGFENRSIRNKVSFWCIIAMLMMELWSSISSQTLIFSCLYFGKLIHLNCWYLKFWQFDLLEFIVWNIKGLRDLVGKQNLGIRKLELVANVKFFEKRNFSV